MALFLTLLVIKLGFKKNHNFLAKEDRNFWFEAF